MCVILIAETTRISRKMIEQAITANGDGNGMSWREGRHVHFEKGISEKRAITLAASLPMPYIFHARIATVGGALPSLTHPFSLDPRTSAWALKGKTKTGVIFHNGHWSDWDQWVPAMKGVPWSDTRSMAHLIREWGNDALDPRVIDQWNKIAWFTPTNLIRSGHGWQTLRPGLWASNDHFLFPRVWSTVHGDYGEYFTPRSATRYTTPTSPVTRGPVTTPTTRETWEETVIGEVELNGKTYEEVEKRSSHGVKYTTYRRIDNPIESTEEKPRPRVMALCQRQDSGITRGYTPPSVLDRSTDDDPADVDARDTARMVARWRAGTLYDGD